MKGVMLVFILILLSGLVSAESIFLSDYMEEGQTKIYEIDGGVYVINLLTVSDVREKAIFRLNDEMSKGIKLKDSYVFDDGSEIVLRELIITESGEGNDEAYYYFYGTGKGTLPLTNVSMYATLDLCNFDTQCKNETKANCCYDCGCGGEGECINNRCVAVEDEEEEEVKEAETEEKIEVKKKEIKAETKNELTKGEREKKAAYAMVGVIVFFAAIMLWFVVKKKRRRRIF